MEVVLKLNIVFLKFHSFFLHYSKTFLEISICHYQDAFIYKLSHLLNNVNVLSIVFWISIVYEFFSYKSIVYYEARDKEKLLLKMPVENSLHKFKGYHRISICMQNLKRYTKI